MPTIDSVVDDLSRMKRRDVREVFNKVQDRWRERSDSVETKHPLRAEMTRAEFARWVALQDSLIDVGLERAFHLPANTPADEVRVLEVSSQLYYGEAFDAVLFHNREKEEKAPFLYSVAGVSHEQFEGIRAGRTKLPEGWVWAGAVQLELSDD